MKFTPEHLHAWFSWISLYTIAIVFDIAFGSYVLTALVFGLAVTHYTLNQE